MEIYDFDLVSTLSNFRTTSKGINEVQNKNLNVPNLIFSPFTCNFICNRTCNTVTYSHNDSFTKSKPHNRGPVTDPYVLR